MGGFFENRWEGERKRVESEKKEEIKELVISLLKGEDLSEEKGGFTSFQVEVTNKQGDISFGTVSKNASNIDEKFREKTIRIKSGTHLSKGQRVEIEPRLEANGEFYLYVYEIDPKSGERASQEPLFTPRFNPNKNSFFENRLEGKIKELVISLLKGEDLSEEKEGFSSFQVEVAHKHGIIRFGTVSKNASNIDEKFREKTIQIKSGTHLSRDITSSFISSFFSLSTRFLSPSQRFSKKPPIFGSNRGG